MAKYLGKTKSKCNKKKKKNTLDRMVDILKEYKQLDEELFPKKLHAVLGNKKRNKPIILMFSADWHLGSRSCNYTQWLEDMRYLTSLNPADVRLFLLGDLIDNVSPRFRSAEAVFGYLRPDMQREMLKEILDEVTPYLEVACWGNHDVEWDEKTWVILM